MTRVASFAFVCVLGVVAGCAVHQPPKPVASKSPNASEAPRGPVIVRLVGQHQVVTVTSGPDGPLYTAQTTDGRTIVANATLAQLRTENPEVYQFIEPAMAADASVDGGAVKAQPGRPQSLGGTGGVSSDRFTREPLMLDSNR
jgi:hypothetical protein